MICPHESLNLNIPPWGNSYRHADHRETLPSKGKGTTLFISQPTESLSQRYRSEEEAVYLWCFRLALLVSAQVRGSFMQQCRCLQVEKDAETVQVKAMNKHQHHLVLFFLINKGGCSGHIVLELFVGSLVRELKFMSLSLLHILLTICNLVMTDHM